MRRSTLGAAALLVALGLAVATAQRPEVGGRVFLDAGGLRAPVPVDVGLLTDARVRLGVGERPVVRLNVAPGVELVAEIEATGPTSAGYSLTGRLVEGGPGSVTLVVNGDVTAGEVSTPGGHYAIRPAGAGAAVVREVDPATLRHEFSYRKRHHYLTLVVDHDRRRVVWAAKGRSAETLHAFFDQLGAAGCARIELVTADLAASYQKAVRARVPRARVVFDRFHVEQLAADAVDEVRRAEQHRLGAPARKALKGMRYALLKRPDRLKPGEVRRLAALRRKNRALDRAYELKEYLATILRQGTLEDADELLDQWLEWAARSRLAPSVKLARTVRKHAAGILAYLDTRMTNGPVEGINNKLRVIARRAYGFHSPGPLISMLFLCCGGIELTPTLPTRV